MTDVDRARAVEVELVPNMQPFIEAAQRFFSDLRDKRPDDDPITCGWKRAYDGVIWALKGR